MLAKINQLLLKKPYFIAISAVVFIFARLPLWFYPFGSDHQIFAYVGNAILDGKSLYIDVWDHKAPLIFFMNSLMILLFGESLFWQRVWLTLLTLIDSAIFYAFTREILKNLQERLDFSFEKRNLLLKWGFLGYILWRNFSQFASSGNNSENVSLIFLMASFWLFYRFIRQNNLLNLALSGLLAGVTVFMKINWVLIFLPFAVELILQARKNKLRALKNFIVLTIPAVVYISLWIGFFWQAGSLKEFYEASFAFNSRYWRVSWFDSLGPRFTFLLIDLFLIIPLISSFWILRKRISSLWQCLETRFIFISGLAGLIFFILSGNYYPYYFLIIIPQSIWLILLLWLNEEKLAIDKVQTNSTLGSFFQKNIVAIIALCTLISGLFSYRQLYNTFWGSSANLDSETAEIADYIKKNSLPTDTIITYIYGSTLYVQAERNSASRFISATPMYLDQKYDFGFEFNQKYLEDMEKNKPRFAILPKDQDDVLLENTELVEYFRKNYTPVKEFETLVVWRRVF